MARKISGLFSFAPKCKISAMRTKKNLTLFICFLLASVFAYAQGSKDDLDSLLDDAPKAYFKASLDYLSDNIYLGRKDSVATPYITPAIEYHFKSGIFLSGSISYLSTEHRIDVSTLGAGYGFSKGKWDGEFIAEKYFYSSQSYSVRSEQKGDMNASIGYDFGFINPSVSGFINFGTKSDYGTSFTLEHTFLLFDEKIDVTPSFVANASTQNYYSAYYKKRKYVKTKKGKKITYSANANTQDASKFKLLDYEFSAPLNYVVKRFTFNFTPTVAVPVNPSVVTLTLTPKTGPSITKTFTENIGTSFFWSAGISYKIKK